MRKTTAVFLVTVFSVFLSSCDQAKLEKYKKPDNLLDRDKMSSVLKDLHYIETKGGMDKLSTADLKKRNKLAYIKVFQYHNVVDSVFFNSLDYYYLVPDSLHLIYHDVVTKMSEDQKRFKKK